MTTPPAAANEAKLRVWQRLGRRRLLTLLATLLLITAAGFAITFLPGSGPESAPAPTPVSSATSGIGASANKQLAPDAAREVDLRFKQAVIMLHAKQYEHAITALHLVLALAPTMPEAHVNMGYALIGLKRYDAARDFFRGAIALKPGQANAHYGLALALAELHDPAAATVAMQTYLRFAPANDPFVAKANAAIAAWRVAETKRLRDGGHTAPSQAQAANGNSR